MFLKYLFFKSKLGILNIFPDDGSIFPTASEKITQKAQGKETLAEVGGRVYVPPAYLVVKEFPFVNNSGTSTIDNPGTAKETAFLAQQLQDTENRRTRHRLVPRCSG